MYFKKLAEFREYQEILNKTAFCDVCKSDISDEIDIVIENVEAISIKENKSLILILEEQIEEGMLSRIFGGLKGLALGIFIGKILARILGLKDDSILYKILTSKTVAFSIGSAIEKGNKSK